MGEDERRIAKIIGAGLAALLVPLFFLFAGYGLGVSGGYYDAQADGYAAPIGTASRDRVERCFRQPDTTIPATRECVEQAIRSSREEQRSEQDLSAQRQMAQWAWWLLVATLAQMPLTALGLLLLLQTIWQGREALQTARDSAADTKRIGQAQTRCYLSIDSLKMKIRADGLIDLMVVLKNSGQSPARDVEVSYLVEIRVLQGKIEQDIAGTIAGNKGKFSIPATSELPLPKQTCTEGIKSDFDAPMSEGEEHVTMTVTLLMSWKDVFEIEFEAVERFSHVKCPWKRNHEYLVPNERDLAAAILSEVSKRRHLGEWTEDSGDES